MINLIRKLFSKTDTAPPPEILVKNIEVPPADPKVETNIFEFDENAVFLDKSNIDSIDPSKSEKIILEAEHWGSTFAIEYIDSKGAPSLRRISMRYLALRPGKSLSLVAHCYERKQLREFRFDRIQSIIDYDGQVFEPTIYFRDEIGCPIDAYIAKAEQNIEPIETDSRPLKKINQTNATKQTPAEKPSAGVAQRRSCRDTLRILVAIARSDNDYCEEELDAILAYIEHEAELTGVSTTDADRVALKEYLKRQRPDGAILDKCLEKLAEAGDDVQLRFLRAAEKVVLADGQTHEAERKIFASIFSSVQLNHLDINDIK